MHTFTCACVCVRVDVCECACSHVDPCVCGCVGVSSRVCMSTHTELEEHKARVASLSDRLQGAHMCIANTQQAALKSLHALQRDAMVRTYVYVCDYKTLCFISFRHCYTYIYVIILSVGLMFFTCVYVCLPVCVYVYMCVCMRMCTRVCLTEQPAVEHKLRGDAAQTVARRNRQKGGGGVIAVVLVTNTHTHARRRTRVLVCGVVCV
jgi:hypothetical protein